MRNEEYRRPVKLKTLTAGKLFAPALGAILTVACGLILWGTPPGDGWVNASYDWLFRFGARSVTNRVVLIQMDNNAYDQFHQSRTQPWDRALHARLLDRLAADGCPLVVFDSFFRARRDPAKDATLINAMRRQRAVVLMAEQARVTHPEVTGARPVLPAELFLTAAGGHWGVAWLDPDPDGIVRRHWPFPAPGPYHSLPWTAAGLAGARLSEEPRKQWLRYYGRDGAWPVLSYGYALTAPTNYFHDKIVFVGSRPKTTVADGEPDEFRTPYTRWAGETVGGVEIMITSFLNLVNQDWLRRLPAWAEALALVMVGVGLAFAAAWTQMRWWTECVLAALVASVVGLGAVAWSYFTNFWFPWLVIAGGQVPCVLAWSLATRSLRAARTASEPLSIAQPPQTLPAPVAAAAAEVFPDTPDYELVRPAFGKGSYGKVWLARNAIGQWQALKAVYLANFDQYSDPYEREFNGVTRYKAVSDKHPGLLQVDFVSKKKETGYFYYVMELGDPLVPGWESEPSTYRPRDLVSERRRFAGQKVPVRECLEIGLALADAVDFLHRQGLTHRDIKPQNIIFVNGRPKLADVGLVAEIRPRNREGTAVGTPGYMPPPPESPGTPHADIYALGMLLYVLSTGHNPSYFPELSTTLVAHSSFADFFSLNDIILKACHPDASRRHGSAAELRRALQEAEDRLVSQTPKASPVRT